MKHQCEVEMYLVEKIKPEYSEHGEGQVPIAAFQQAYQELKSLEGGG